MAEKCKRCGAPIFARFADLTGGLCTACAREKTAAGDTDPAKLRAIVDTGDTPQAKRQAKPQAESSEHGRKPHVHKAESTRQAKPRTPSSEHASETAKPETPSESISEHIGFRVTPTMMEQLRNAVQLKSTPLPDILRQAIAAYLAGES